MPTTGSVIVAIGLLLSSAAESAVEEMTANELAAQSLRYLEAELRPTHPNATVSIEVLPLDARLRFPTCATLAFSRRGGPYGRVSVTAKCRSPMAWSAVLPARVNVMSPVVVLRRPLPRNSLIGAGDLTLEPRDLADLRGDFVTDPTLVTGWTTKRDLAAGAVLTARQLKPSITVGRGDEVKITAGTGPIRVQATGTALTQGATGELISVRNITSERLIRAWVTGPGRVTIRPPEARLE